MNLNGMFQIDNHTFLGRNVATIFYYEVSTNVPNKHCYKILVVTVGSDFRWEFVRHHDSKDEFLQEYNDILRLWDRCR